MRLLQCIVAVGENDDFCANLLKGRAMENLRIGLSLVDDSLLPIEADTGAGIIDALFGDDVNPPARYLKIEATSEDGQTVCITVGASDSTRAGVSVEIAEEWKKCPECDNGVIYSLSVPEGKKKTKPCDYCGGSGRVKKR